MLAAIETWLAAHPVVRGALIMLAIAVLGAVYNWVTYKRTPEEWARYQLEYPWRAFVIRVMRIVFPHLRKIPALKPFFPDAPTSGTGGDRDAKPPPPPPSAAYRISLEPRRPGRDRDQLVRIGALWMKLGVACLAAVMALTSCVLFRPAKEGQPPPAQAVLLYTAKVLLMLNQECAKAADVRRARANADPDPAARLDALKKADALAEECDRATVAGRSSLEAVELLIESGRSIADAKIGCAIKKGLDATSDVCTAMRVAKVIDRCPAYVDTAITFGSPLIAAVGACPLEEKTK